ncbi:MAG: hypothetical protein M3297_02840 [Thermoproteota archaeon]|nr:hypothetical protein [Thermoproteota archaeon]
MATHNRSFNKGIQIVDKPRTFVAVLETISEAKETFDCCIDSRGLSFLMRDEQIWSVMKGLKSRNINSRFITEITSENMHYANLLLKVGEVNHNDGLKGNFIIIDSTSYSYYLIDNDNSGNDQNIIESFHTQVKPFVEAQQHLFDSLRSRSIPAKERIREIGRGIKGDFVDFIESASEIKNTTTELIESATFEILLLFSTTNSFYRAEYSGMLNALWQASERGVTVKLLIQGSDDDNRLKEMIQNTVKRKNSLINVQCIARQLETKITTLVVDQAVALAIEVNDDMKETFEESTGIAIYSNNESKVSSSLTIFETLWIQSEFDKQNKIKQAYFQMFKGLQLKDELYIRRWSSEQQQTRKDEK